MVGEWFFADVAFPQDLPPEHEFIRDILTPITSPDVLRRLLEARAGRFEFIDRCARTLAATRAHIVGFTTTFHQTCACLSIAKRLKELANPPIIAFGGANCEGKMGQQMIRSFPWIDYVCTREGDDVFPSFVELHLKKGRSAGLPGFLNRTESDQLTFPPVIEAMDNLPIPGILFDSLMTARQN
jgi:hypothetical protein